MKQLGLAIIMMATLNYLALKTLQAESSPTSATSTIASITESDPTLEHTPSAVLDKATESRCVGCHKNMEMIPPSGVHATFACTACHEPHEGTPQSVEQYGLKACTISCHGQHDLGQSHPIGDDLRDRTGITLTCVSACHSMHLPNFGQLLRAEGSDVCAGCHTEKF